MTQRISGNEPVEQLIELAIQAAHSGGIDIPSHGGIENSEVLREINLDNVSRIEWLDNGYAVHGESNVREMVERIPSTRNHPREDVFKDREFRFGITVQLLPFHSPPQVGAKTEVHFI